MTRSLIQCVLWSLIGVVASGIAYASSPTEKLICTKAPRGDWMSETKIREVFGDKAYAQVKFKISRGNCYEFYAVHKDGSIVEAYYHPVSGEVMRFNRVTTTSATSVYESRGAAPPTGKP